MNGNYYILEGDEIKVIDLMTWARWMNTSDNRRVALDKIGDVEISTVFLGLDRNFTLGGDRPRRISKSSK